MPARSSTTSAPSTPGCRASSRSSSTTMPTVLPSWRARRILTRGLAAVMAPALAVVVGAPAAQAATRHVWVAAEPATWNAVPNARDVIHGGTFEPGQTTFPTVVYARYTRDWAKRLTRRIPGPLIRARVGDELRIHFKNLDTLHTAPH